MAAVIEGEDLPFNTLRPTGMEEETYQEEEEEASEEGEQGGNCELKGVRGVDFHLCQARKVGAVLDHGRKRVRNVFFVCFCFLEHFALELLVVWFLQQIHTFALLSVACIDYSAGPGRQRTRGRG